MESGWVPWLIKQKTSANEALYLVGGSTYFGWLAVWGSNPNWRSEWKSRRLGEASTPGGGNAGRALSWHRNYALAFTLQQRKITVKPQSGQLKSAWQITAEHDLFGRLGHRLAVASTGLLAPVALGLHLRGRGQPSARVNICRGAELRGSPLQLTLSRNSQLGLWRCRRKKEHPNPRESACY